MLVLILGIVVFLGVHTLAAFRETRAGLIERYGLQNYKRAYALVAAIGLLLIIVGFIRYRAEGLIYVWTPPSWGRHVAMPLVWFAFVALASRRAPPGRIRGWLRHPTLVAVKSWALAHLLVNGDLGGMILFGSFLAWGVFDRISVKRRGDAGAPRLDAFTRGDAIALGAGTAIYVLLLFLHPYLFGVAVLRG
ncbi:NnrU family protein [Methylocystis sp. 9N]|uniref:NnrU family protein n=1 Tax=Methylocystis borbori TaxID=3118750 RepID=A0ABU7XFH5_9HYPH